MKAVLDKLQKRSCIRPFCYNTSTPTGMRNLFIQWAFQTTGLAMNLKSALKLFFFQAIAVFFAEVIAGSTFSRYSYFTTWENKQLKGHVVKRFDSPSLLSCGQQCMRNACCTSTNYKMSSKKDGKGTCELNNHDVSIINENAEFVVQQRVTFSMLLKVKRTDFLNKLETIPPIMFRAIIAILNKSKFELTKTTKL